MTRSTSDFLQKLLSRPSKVLDRFGEWGLRLFLYRENLYFNPDLNGEHHLIRQLKKHGFDADVVFDIGANVGRWTEEAMKVWPNARFCLFDPADAPCRELRKRFDSVPEVTVYQAAIGSISQNINVAENKETSSHSFVLPDASGSGSMISGAELLTLTGESRIDFMKIDAEGFDLKIIESIEQHLAAGRIRIIQFEHYPLAVNYGMKLSDILAAFRRHGFLVGKIFPEGLRDITLETDRWSHVSGTNFVAFSPVDAQLFKLLVTR